MSMRRRRRRLAKGRRAIVRKACNRYSVFNNEVILPKDAAARFRELKLRGVV